MTDGVAIPADYGPREIMPAEAYVQNKWKALELGGGPPSEIAQAFEKLKSDELIAARRAADRLISDPELRPLLELLTDFTLRRPPVIGFGKKHEALGRRREGRCEIVMQIYALIAEHRSQLPPQREGMIE
mgnify:CR=1 FL=1